MLKRHTLNSLTSRRQYKYPFFFLGFYLAFLLSTVCLANKLTLIGNLLLPGGIFVFTFTFAICDIVGEVYGYAYPRLFIWIGVIIEFIFSIIVILVSHTPSPDYFEYSEAYQIVFDPTFRYVASGVVALLLGEFMNVYLLTKWKIILRGKFFVLRSLVSTAIGQATLTIVVDILNYVGKMSINDLIWMMISGYTWKIIFAIIFVLPSWLLVRYLKRVENVDHYDIHTNFNPFILSLGEKNYAPSP